MPNNQRLTELVKVLTELEGEDNVEKLRKIATNAVRSEIATELGFTGVVAVKETRGSTPRALRRTKDENGEEKTQPTLKELVLTILMEKPGLTLRETADIVTDKVEKKEFKTNAESHTAITSQALNKLRDEGRVKAEKDETVKKNRYWPVAAVDSSKPAETKAEETKTA